MGLDDRTFGHFDDYCATHADLKYLRLLYNTFLSTVLFTSFVVNLLRVNTPYSERISLQLTVNL